MSKLNFSISHFSFFFNSVQKKYSRIFTLTKTEIQDNEVK